MITYNTNLSLAACGSFECKITIRTPLYVISIFIRPNAKNLLKILFAGDFAVAGELALTAYLLPAYGIRTKNCIFIFWISIIWYFNYSAAFHIWTKCQVLIHFYLSALLILLIFMIEVSRKYILNFFLGWSRATAILWTPQLCLCHLIFCHFFESRLETALAKCMVTLREHFDVCIL